MVEALGEVQAASYTWTFIECSNPLTQTINTKSFRPLCI